MDQPPAATRTVHRTPSVTWAFAHTSTKPYIPPGLDPPQHPLKKVRAAAQLLKQTKSKPYSVLGYCDDITTLSSTLAAHQAALSDVDHWCSDLGLQVRPDKRASYIHTVIGGKKTHNHTCFNLTNSQYYHLCSNKVLRPNYWANPQTIKSFSTKKIIKKVYRVLDEIDKRSIRCEDKVGHHQSLNMSHLLHQMLVEHPTLCNSGLTLPPCGGKPPIPPPHPQ